MFLFSLPLLLFAQAPTLDCEDYDWLVGGLERNTSMTSRTRSEILFTLLDSTDPKCFEVKSKDAKAD